MKPHLPLAWEFTVRQSPGGQLKFAPAATHGGLYLEVRSIADYQRAELIVDDPTPRPSSKKGRWNLGIWAHRDTEEEAIAAVEALAVAAGVADPRGEEK